MVMLLPNGSNGTPRSSRVRSLGGGAVRGIARHVYLSWLAYMPDAHPLGWYYLKESYVYSVGEGANYVHLLAHGWPRVGK